jgi:glycerophosphoryl diester phosphodiesterase
MRVERIAHRGAKREFSENTIPAFARAFELGADAIELDVHATADGVVIVHHDPDIRLGRKKVQLADAEFDRLHQAGVAERGGIPRLQSVLAIVPSGRTVYIEIKGAGIEARVSECIRQGPESVRCAVHSFDHGAIEVMRDIAPEIPRGILFERDTTDVLDAMARTGARDVWPHWKLIDAALVDAIHAAGGRVLVWTVNDADVAARLIAVGVDGLCGDDVRVFPRE